MKLRPIKIARVLVSHACKESWPVKEVPDARRARNRRAQAYFFSTSERGDRAQRNRWAFFNGRGFSLLEVVVAMAIISVGVVTVLEIFSSGLRLVARTSIATEAAARGREVMDEALSQNTIPEGGAGATGVNGGSWKVETRPVGAEKGFTLAQPWSLEEVQVEVRYRAGLSEREVTLRTLRLVKGRPRL